ncbi:unnamed protein product [Absidia cylindrospora]
MQIVSLIVNYIGQRDLYTCTLINKRFYLATKPLFWETAHVRNDSKARRFLRAVDDALPSVGHYLRHIDLGDMVWSDMTFLVLMQHIRHLKSLYIRNGEYITDRSFSHFPRGCIHLTTLHLEQCNITHTSIQAIGQHCHQLCKLALVHCKLFSPAPIDFSALHDCPLEELTVGGGLASTTTLVAGCFPLLTRLTLFGGSHDVIEQILTTNDWPRLTHLTLGDYPFLGDAPVISFINAHPLVIDLHLHNIAITDATLDAISVVLPGITRLAVINNHCLTALRLRQLIRECVFLAFVSVQSCGIYRAAFPEIHDGCQGYTVRHCGPLIFMEHLGQESIHCIRHAPILVQDKNSGPIG